MTEGNREERAVTSVLACINLKGGVGKSTLAVNVACCLARTYGQRVVLFDADRQGSSVAWAGRGLLPVPVLKRPLEGTVSADRWAADLLGEATDRIAVIDSPPHLDTVVQAVVGITNLAVVPVTPSPADLLATLEALRLVRAARDLRRGLPQALLVPSRVDRRTLVGREIEAALAACQESVGPAVGQRSSFVDAFSAGQWIGDYAPSSAAAREIGALTACILQMIAG